VSAPEERALAAPAPLAAEHELEPFISGTPQLDDWLKRRARQNEAGGASRTYVIPEGRRVVGYYSLAAGSVLHEAATGRVRRNMPDPIPVALLGRLAVDQGWQGRELGAALLRDAVLRAMLYLTNPATTLRF
jgi:GNAT superfamily N-acetyltransferase